MGLLDNTSVMKLPERFLTKGPQNGIQGLELTRVIVLGRSFNLLYKSKVLDAVLNETEDGQLKVDGIARKQYDHGIEVFEKPANAFEDKGKK